MRRGRQAHDLLGAPGGAADAPHPGVVALFAGCLVAWEFHGRILDALKHPFRRRVARRRSSPASPTSTRRPGRASPPTSSSRSSAARRSPRPSSSTSSGRSSRPASTPRRRSTSSPSWASRRSSSSAAGGSAGASPSPSRSASSLASRARSARTAFAHHADIMVDDYIDFCLQLMLGFGLIFELPMLLLFLSIAGSSTT